jgi:hypothetical protein
MYIIRKVKKMDHIIYIINQSICQKIYCGIPYCKILATPLLRPAHVSSTSSAHRRPLCVEHEAARARWSSARLRSAHVSSTSSARRRQVRGQQGWLKLERKREIGKKKW